MIVRRLLVVGALSIGVLQADDRVSELESKVSELTKRLDELKPSQIELPKEVKPLAHKVKTDVSVGGRIDLETTYGSQKGELFADKRISLEGGSNDLQMTARASRLWFRTQTATDYGPLRTLLEIDFKASSEGNEKTVNNRTPGLRHAFAQIGKFTFGQTFSTFNGLATVETVSLIINDTMVRQPLMRLSHETGTYGFDIAVEKPQTTLMKKDGKIEAPSSESIPDVIARLRYYPKWGEASIAALATAQEYEKSGKTDRAYGYGVNLSAKIKSFGNDNIVIDAQYGEGLGRYMAYGAYSAGFVNDKGEVSLQKTYGGHIGYRHVWAKDWRSTLAYAYTKTENKKIVTSDEANKNASSVQANLFYNFIPKGVVGLEYVYGTRKVQSNEKDKLHMGLLLVRYNF